MHSHECIQMGRLQHSFSNNHVKAAVLQCTCHCTCCFIVLDDQRLNIWSAVPVRIVPVKYDLCIIIPGLSARHELERACADRIFDASTTNGHIAQCDVSPACWAR